MTVEYLSEAVEKGLERYRARQADGADMAQAGVELFSYLEHAIAPRPCAPPSRQSMLALIVRNNDPQDLLDLKEMIVESAAPGEEDLARKQLLQVIDQRVALLRETDSEEERDGGLEARSRPDLRDLHDLA